MRTWLVTRVIDWLGRMVLGGLATAASRSEAGAAPRVREANAAPAVLGVEDEACAMEGAGALQTDDSTEGKVLWWVSVVLKVPAESLWTNMRLVDDLGATEPQLVELVMQLEDEFSVVLPDWLAERRGTTIEDLVDAIQAGKDAFGGQLSGMDGDAR